MKKRKKEKTIFRTILFAMLLVLGIEIVLLVSALYLSNVSTRLNQNAMDLLDMQTSNRADYLESILLFNQDLSRLSSCINEKASELSAAQKLDLSRIGDSSAEALPLLEEISSAMISTLRSKSVTGVFVAFTTEEFSKSSTVSAHPTVPFTALSVSRCLSPICSRFFPIPSCRTKAMERIFSFPRLPLH